MSRTIESGAPGGQVRPFWFTPSMVHPQTRIMARCMTCRHNSALDLDALLARFGDVPLYTLQPRLRCRFRGHDGKQPPCGRRGVLDVWAGVREVRPTEIVYWPVCREDLASAADSTSVPARVGSRNEH